MTDYYQVIASGIADLKTNSPESRREFYWLARTELEVQLCSVDPRFTQSEIVRERMALNEAIRKIEGEHELLLGTQRLDAARAKPLVSPDPETLSRTLIKSISRSNHPLRATIRQCL